MKNIEEKFEQWFKSYFGGFHTSNPSECLDSFKMGYETAKAEYKGEIKQALEIFKNELTKHLPVGRIEHQYINSLSDQFDMIVCLKEIKTRIKEAEEALKFYCDPGHWGINKPGATTSIDPCDQEHYDDEYSNYGIRGGKRAREYFKKWSNDKSSQEG